MLCNFNDVFHPENKWKNKRLTKHSPCNNCDIYKEYETKALYGNIAERQYAELPNSCDACIKRTLWLMDCLQKLKWYEDNDKTLEQ